MQTLQTTQPITVSAHWTHDFDQFLDGDYRKITHRQLKKKSISLARQHVRVFTLWHEAKFNGAFEPVNLTNYDLHVYRQWSLEQEGVMARTWNSRHWALGIFCKWIEVTSGFANLMDGVDQQEVGLAAPKHRSLTEDERNRLIHTLQQDPRRAVTAFEYQVCIRDWAIVSLMLHAGLRVDEVHQLDVRDIKINERSGSVLVRNGKGSKERAVPLSLPARNALAAWLDLRPASTSQALFTGKDSPRLSTRSMQRIVEEIGGRILVKEMTCHWLRYTFAKMMEIKGVAIETIRDLLGHSSIEITRRYLRASIDELQSAVEVW